jgi:ubiquinone/menaquinone biosynthesis C-methylase UbiE
MPEEEVWATFFQPEELLQHLGLTNECRDVVEFGCGYGTFTVPAAKIVRGTVYALDIERAMIATTKRKAEHAGLNNIVARQCDFLEGDLEILNGSADYVMLFNILHAEHPELLLSRAYQLLRSQGTLAIMHWNYDPSTPRGPRMEIRPRPEQCRDWATGAGFELRPPGIVDLPPFHYGMALRKV